MADAAWYYAQNKQKVGPFSFTELQRLVASGQLSPTDMVLQAGTPKWVAASAVHGLFPAVVPTPLATAGGSTPATGRAKMWASLKAGGKRLLDEGGSTIATTWRQTVRLVQYGRGLWRGRSLRRTARTTQLALGERLFAAGLGDAGLLARLAALDEQTRTQPAEGRPTKSLQHERKDLLVHLAAAVLAQPVPPAAMDNALREAQEAQGALQNHEAAMKGLKAELAPKGATEWCRVGIGYAAAVAIILLAVALWPGGRAGTGSESALASADRGSLPADGREASPPTDTDRGGRLPEIGPVGGESVYKGKSLSAWIALLKDKNEFVRAEAAQALGKIGPKTDTVVPALIAALKDESGFVRADAARALEEIGPPAKAAVIPLAEALKDEDGLVRNAAISALGKLGPDAKEAVPALVATLGDKELRVLALYALGLIGPAAGSALPAVAPRTKDSDPEVRQAATSAFTEIGRGDVATLLKMSKKGDDELRSLVAETLRRIGPEDTAAIVPLAEAAKETEEEHWFAVVGALGRIGPAAKTATGPLTTALKNQSVEVRIAAARTLAKVNPDATNQAVTVLTEALNAPMAVKYPGTRAAALEALGTIGPKAKASVPAIVALLEDKYEGVRRAAADALKQIDPERARIAGTKPGTPGRDDQPVDRPAPRPAEGEYDPLVQELLGATSDFYSLKGFKEYKFGTSRKEVEAISPIVGKLIYGWLTNRDQTELLFAENDRLVAVGKVYRGDNETYAEQLKDLFGKTDLENVERFSVARDRVREEVVRITYQFPDSIVVMRVMYGTIVGLNGSTHKDDRVALAVYDARWARQELDRDIRMKRQALAWFRDAVKAAGAQGLDVDQLPEYPGAIREKRSVGHFEGVYFTDAKLRPESGKKDDKKPIPGRDPDWFSSFVRLTRKTSEHPQGTVIVTLRLGVVPGSGATSLFNTSLSHKVIRCNSALAQQYFPPKGETITVVTDRTSTMKSYEWMTKENIKVQVTGQNTIVLTRSPSQL